MTTKKKTLLSVVCVTWSMWTPAGLFKTLSFFVTLLHHGLSQRPISKKCSLRYVQSRTFRDSLFLALNQRILFSYYLEMYVIKYEIQILHVVVSHWFVIFSDITWVQKSSWWRQLDQVFWPVSAAIAGASRHALQCVTWSLQVTLIYLFILHYKRTKG